jgi:hypothetical protein
MLAPAMERPPKGTARVVAAMAVLFLGAIAAAVPPPPIEAGTAQRRGYLESFARFNDDLAYYLARDGFSFLALDLATADPSADAHWREQKRRVDRRRFPVWGWLDASLPHDRAERLVRELRLDGLFVFGEEPAALAAAARAWRSGLEVVEVVPETSDRARGAPAVAMGLETFEASFTDPASPFRQTRFRVLLAGSLDRSLIDKARGVATGDYLVARR